MAVVVDTSDSRKPPGSTPRWLSYPRGVLRFLLGSGPRHLWGLSLLLLVAVAVCAYFDPLYVASVIGFIPEDSSNYVIGFPVDTSGRRIATLSGGILVLAIFILLLAGAWRGPKPYRSLKSLLMFTTLACLWIGLAFSLENIAWFGKQARIGSLLGAIEPITDELTKDWPSRDGKSPTLGPYKTYPLRNPTTLILMISPQLPESRVRLTQVIRSEQGALRFLLAGSEHGDWLEWHPEDSKPTQFSDRYHVVERALSRSTDLGDGWYLVRYNW